MEFNFQEIIATVIPQLGFGVIFLWLFYSERKSNDENIKGRDLRIKELTDASITAYTKNTEVIQRVSDSVANNTSSIERNTVALQNMTEKLLQLLKN